MFKISIIRTSALFLALGIGVLVGTLTASGQGLFPPSFDAFFNSGAIWLVPAFFLATRSNGWLESLLVSLLDLIGSVLGYYLTAGLKQNRPSLIFSDTSVKIWLLVALIAGPLFGFGAYLYRRKTKFYEWGASFLPAVFLAEGLVEILNIKEYYHMLGAVYGRLIIGFIIYLLIYRRKFWRFKPLFSVLALTILGLLADYLIAALSF